MRKFCRNYIKINAWCLKVVKKKHFKKWILDDCPVPWQSITLQEWIKSMQLYCLKVVKKKHFKKWILNDCPVLLCWDYWGLNPPVCSRCQYNEPPEDGTGENVTLSTGTELKTNEKSTEHPSFLYKCSP